MAMMSAPTRVLAVAQAPALARSQSLRSISTIKQVGVCGLGLMGHGIVQVAAMVSSPAHAVVAVETDRAALESGRSRIDESLSKMFARKIKHGSMTDMDANTQKQEVLSRISYTSQMDALSDCDIVIEAITENPKIKLPFFAKLGSITRSDCILASNTSSLSITDMAKVSGRSSHVVGLHFFNPVQMMKLVEVVKTDSTDPAIFDHCKSWVQRIGKYPVSCKDTPGFIVNRLLVPGLAQGMLMLDRGDGSVEDIDKSMELGAGYPMGPLTLADYVGLDTCLSILEGWVTKYPTEPSFVVPKCLRQKVACGKLGRKTGEGFYKWNGDKRADVAR